MVKPARLLQAFVAAGLLILAGCNGPTPPYKVLYPRYGFRNTTVQELVSVKRSGTATILEFKCFYNPGEWIRVSPDTYITDGRNRYALKETEGITPGDTLVMDSDGCAEYRLLFEPVPAKVRDISMIESKESPVASNFYHIDLSDMHRKVVRDTSTLQGTLPEISLRSGESTVEVRMPCRMEGLPEVPVALVVDTFFPAEKQVYTATLDDFGQAVFTFRQNGPARASVEAGYDLWYGYFLLEPGDTATVLIDGSERELTSKRFRAERKPVVNHIVKGKYASLDRLDRFEADYSFNVYSGRFAWGANKMSDYADTVRSTYNDRMEALAANDSIPPLAKEYLQRYIASQAILALSKANDIRRDQYSLKHGGSVKGYVEESFAEKDLAFLREMDLNSPKMLCLGSSGMLGPGLAELVFPDGKGLQAEYAKALSIARKAQAGDSISDSDLDILTPFYRDCLKTH